MEKEKEKNTQSMQNGQMNDCRGASTQNILLKPESYFVFEPKGLILTSTVKLVQGKGRYLQKKC